MCLSIFARIDNVIPCFLVMAAIYVTKQWNGQLGSKAFFLITILFAVCYAIVGLIAWQYGWSIFFYNDFAHRLHPKYGSGDNFGFKDYFRLMYEHIMSAINHSYFAIFMALHVLNVSKCSLSKKDSFDGLFALLIPVILVIRFILYPDISDRFYIAYYLVIVVLLVKNFSPLLKLSRFSVQKDP
jgi:hypothetical protein